MLRLREPPATEAGRQRDPAAEAADEHLPGQVLCRACSAHVTDTDSACERAGAHLHQRVNPAGEAFEIALYTPTPGCTGSGMALARDSWFPPARWRIARCTLCAVQLGWFFEGQGPTFAGLILDRIRIEIAPTRH